MDVVRVGETFAGIGGIRKGLEQASHIYKTVWANEWDRYACSIYRHNFGTKELVEGDIHEIDTNNIPAIDMLVGGFPCQPFSLAGKREGFKDIRGTLFYEIVRITESKRPKILLLENVNGLRSHDKGDTLETILRTLGDLDYWYECQVLNSKHFGVPQNRERIFIVGHSREGHTKTVFPFGEVGQNIIREISTGSERSHVASAIRSRDYKDGTNFIYWKNSNEKWVEENRQDSLALKGQGDLCRQPLILQEHSFSGEGGRGRGFRTYGKGICPTLPTQMGTGGNNIPLVVADRSRSYAGKGRNLESPKEITNTLSGVQKDNLILLDNLGGNIKERVKPLDENVSWTLGGSKTGVTHKKKIRTLMPIECERLQGFPDHWTKYGYVDGKTLLTEDVYDYVMEVNEDGDEEEVYVKVASIPLLQPLPNTVLMSRTQRLKTLGNAVTVNVVEALGKVILERCFSG
jgi:DNA-cytosine methyltransferase